MWLVKNTIGKEMRRIVYLAGVRNQGLTPFQALKKAGIKFDKLLFLNDLNYLVRFLGRPGVAQTAQMVTLKPRPRMQSHF